ncbi:hypothetical protein [Sediminitomix flava]|uniref:Capsule assembly protein Wzi n=1 Tax=Sediminitomix flava TaxID=379075 RepID=A0A315Z2Q4_SEDFL|nr:hypothetical protein [Sediminitomix flava]PWJ36066.1 hypothetical protein BC781_10981 [Sediminitomix flava]
MNRFWGVFSLLFFGIFAANAQSSNVPLNKEYYYLLDRYEILNGGNSDYYTTVKAYKRSEVASFIEQMYTDSTQQFSLADQYNLTYLLRDNWEWISDDSLKASLAYAERPFLKHFYTAKSDFFSVEESNFDLHVNPVLHFSTGKDNNLDELAFINTRGAEVRGVIGNKIGFYFYMTENQSRTPDYIQDEVNKRKSIPGEGYYKMTSNGAYDYFQAKGYINFNVIDEIDLQFGYDRNFIGNGYRSMVLSDNATDYLFFRFNTKVWKLNYTNIFAQMIANNQKGDDGLFPRKYMAFHHLGVDITKNLNIGIFESISYGRDNGFDVTYFNPIIFYRAIEFQLGDNDSAMLGADLKWNFLKHFQLYGQFVIDDILLSEFFTGSGWFANKIGGQIGLKYINAFGVDNLDLQMEYNAARPYMYTHKGEVNYGNHQHYQQALAHPLGANFQEVIGIMRYQPSFMPKLSFVGKMFLSEQGIDITDEENWGSNIYLDYNVGKPDHGVPNNTDRNEYGHKIGQGVLSRNLILDGGLSYQVFHNFFVDMKYTFRWNHISDPEQPAPIEHKTNFVGMGLRWNIQQKTYDF